MKKMMRCFFAVILFFLLISGHTYAENSVPVTVEAYVNQKIEGTITNERFWSFDLPVLNGSGQIAFMADVIDDGNIFSSIWTKSNNGPLTLLVKDDMEARAVSRSVFFSFNPALRGARRFVGEPSRISINDQGEIAFSYFLEDTNNPGELFFSVWMGSSTATLSPVIYHGMTNPEGGTFSNPDVTSPIPYSLNDKGQMAFGYPVDSSDLQLWLGGLQCGADYTLIHITDLDKANTTPFYLNNKGFVGYKDREGIWLANQNGFTSLVLTGEDIPDCGDIYDRKLSLFKKVSFNNAGPAAFVYTNSSFSRTSDIYGVDISGNIRCVETGGVSSMPAAHNHMIMLDDGRIAYSALKETDLSGRQVSFVGIEGTIIAESGDLAPDSSTEEQFGVFWLMAANNKGQVVFRASLSAGGAGLYVADALGNITKIIQTGDEIKLAPDDIRTVGTVNAHNSSNLSGPNPKIINDDGKFVFLATLQGVWAILSAELGKLVQTAECNEGESVLTAANFASSGAALGSVNTFTGELVLSEPADIYPGGPLPLFFSRYYASSLDRDGEHTLGRNWSHNFEMTLSRLAIGINRRRYK